MIIKDAEFGEIIVRKSPLSRSIKFSVATSGRLQMSVPTYTPTFLIKKSLESSRASIRQKLPLKDPKTQRARDYQKKLLLKQAQNYLPARLAQLAKRYHYNYDKCRLTHANTRWGSCSSNKTISLNIGLMKTPEPLRDYVIIHELAHLNHMDHSAAFWREVAAHDPYYKNHRDALRQFEPGV